MFIQRWFMLCIWKSQLLQRILICADAVIVKIIIIKSQLIVFQTLNVFVSKGYTDRLILMFIQIQVCACDLIELLLLCIFIQLRSLGNSLCHTAVVFQESPFQHGKSRVRKLDSLVRIVISCFVSTLMSMCNCMLCRTANFTSCTIGGNF